MSLNENSLRRIQESLNDILECSVCKDVFEDARMLPCIHSFCLKCLKEMLSRCTENVITCPMCRSEFPMPENGVDGLRKNFFLMRLEETMQKLQIVNSNSGTKSSCDVCCRDSVTVGEPPNAERYCSDCKERLCSKCCSSHNSNVLNRKHNLIAISDNPERKVELERDALIFCDIHKQHPIDMYCLRCREVLCARCYIERHPHHEKKLITEASQMFHDQLQQSIARLSPDKDILLRKKEELENGKSAVLLEMAQLEKTIIDIRDAVVKRADDDAKSLLLMLSLKKKEKEKDFEMLIGDVMFKYSCLDSYLSYCKGLSSEGSDFDVCQAAHWLETRFNELRQSNAVVHQSSEVRFQMECQKTDVEVFLSKSNVIGQLFEAEISRKLPSFEESENATEVNNTYMLKMKPQLSDSSQPHMQAAESEDTGGSRGGSSSGTNIKSNNGVSSTVTSESDVSGFTSSTEEVVVQSLESSCEQPDDNSSVLERTRSKQSSLFGWMFGRSNSGGDISETESSNDGGQRSRQSSESEDYRRDPFCSHTIKTKNSAMNNAQPISGITVLYQELYVVSDANSTVEVYDTRTFALVRELCISGLVDPGDIASCANNSCIYIVDWKSRDHENEIFKVDSAGTLIKKWTTPDDYSWISMTHESHIVLTLLEENMINEYKPSGLLIRSVKIHQESGVRHLWHAIKLTNGNFIISHGLKNCHRVCQVNASGAVMNSFGENSGIYRLRSAVYLAEDSHGSILVVDQSSGRVVQLNSNLEFQKQLVTKRHNLHSPIRVFLDESKGRLFVADRKCLISIFNSGAFRGVDIE